MEQFLHWSFDTARGCYVMGSLLLTLMMAVHYVSLGKRFHSGHWKTLFTCLPVVNLIMIAYLLLEGVSVMTGKQIVIGRRRG
jgi:hypothetical protein